MLTRRACATAIAGSLFAQRGERLPNLVLILTDNQRAWTLGCPGSFQ